MLRVGLTGGLGSGKSAVGLVWASAGVPVLEADALGRELMQPGEAVYAAIVEAFGPGVVRADGQLDRAALGRAAFDGERLGELNAIVHPPVIAAQEQALRRLEAEGVHAVAVVESALIFEVSPRAVAGGSAGGSAGEVAGEFPGEVAGEFTAEVGGGDTGRGVRGWRERFHKLVLVAAPEPLRVERFVLRVGGSEASEEEKERLRADARRRMAAQWPEAAKRPYCDYVIENDRTLVLLRREALRVLQALRADAGQ